MPEWISIATTLLLALGIPVAVGTFNLVRSVAHAAQTIKDVSTDLREHIHDENERMRNVFEALSALGERLARIEGRLHRNGITQ